MKPGSVIMDLAAQSGGNCELSKPGETVVVDGVRDRVENIRRISEVAKLMVDAGIIVLAAFIS